MKRLVFLVAILLCAAACRPVPDDLRRAEALLASKPAEAVEILELSPSRDTRKSSDHALWCLLDVWARYNNYEHDISEEELDEAYTWFLKHGGHHRKAQAYYVHASVGKDQNIGDEARWMDDLQRGCHEVESCRDDNLAALLWQHYGAHLVAHKWYDRAIEALEKSCDYAAKAGMLRHQVSSLINISHAYLYIGDEDKDYTRAIEAADKACTVASSMPDKEPYSKALAALASCYSRAGDFQQSLSCSQEAIRLQEAFYASGKRKEPVHYLPLSDAWRKLENADSCIFYALKHYDDPSLVARMGATQMLASAYGDILHDDANAAKYLAEYTKLLHQRDQQAQDGKVNADQLSFERELQEQKQANILLTVLLAMVFVTAAFAAMIRFYTLRVRRSEAALEQARGEVRKVTARARKASEDSARKTAILVDNDKLVEAIRKSPHYLSDQEWGRLETIIDQAYEGWCSALRSDGVSDGGIRAAVCVKLRFSNSDSATLLGISPASFVKAKQRLKGRLKAER